MKLKIIEPLLRFNPKNISQNHQKVKHQNFILITRNHDNIHWRTQNIPTKMSLLGEDQEKDRDDNLRGLRKRKVSMKEDFKGFDTDIYFDQITFKNYLKYHLSQEITKWLVIKDCNIN